MVTAQEHGVGTQSTSLGRRHRRKDSESPRFVVRRGNDSTRARSTHDHGLAHQFRMSPQLDRDIERIHVDVQYAGAWIHDVSVGGGLEAIDP